MSEKKLRLFKRICLSFLCLFFTALFISFALEPTVTAQQDAWKVTLEEGKTATSNLKINNRCSEPHLFRLEENMKYLSFNEPADSILVAPGSSKAVGVTFNATGLKPDVYEDDIDIICLDCKKERTCKQDKDKHPVQLTVIKPKPTVQPTVNPKPPVNSSQQESDKCQAKMAQETDEYIKDKKIELKNPSFKFYGNKDEQVYAVSSQEPVNLSSGFVKTNFYAASFIEHVNLSSSAVKTTFAVLNAKDKTGKSVFFTMEREIKPGMVTYFVKKDSAVVQTMDVKMPSLAELLLTPNPVNWEALCASLLTGNKERFEAAMLKANQTCRTQYYSTCFCPQQRGSSDRVMCFLGNKAKPTRCWEPDPKSGTAALSKSGGAGGCGEGYFNCGGVCVPYPCQSSPLVEEVVASIMGDQSTWKTGDQSTWKTE